MAVPQQLLQQLLALDESARRELGQALLDSVDDDDDGMTAAERAKLDAAIERGIAEADAGKGIPAEQVIAELRARREARARAAR